MALHNTVTGNPCNKQVQPQGTKTHVKLQPAKEIPVTENCRMILSKKYRKKARLFRILHVTRVPVEEIKNRFLLAHTIRKNYGYGRFTVQFWSYYVKNKRYSENWHCIPKRCGYYAANKCRKWNTHQKGDQCKMNRPYKPNWSKRAELEIFPAVTDYVDIDFKYKYYSCKMFYFRKWFWED